MEQLFLRILNMSLTAGITILAVLIIRFMLKKAPKIFSYALWAVVLFRLLCPFSFSSAVSLLGVLRAPQAEQGKIEYIPENIGLMEQPSVNLPVPAMENAVNESLPAANIEASVNPMQIVTYIGACVWLLGIIIMLAYGVVTYLKLRSRLKKAVHDRDNIFIASDISTPFVCGILAPKIFLPLALRDEEKQYILLHEQIHIKRGDHILRSISFFALCLHWFNPLVWIAFFTSGKDMEMSCDEAVIRKVGSSVKKEYSASLLSLASGRKIVTGIPLAFGEGETGSRIKNILKYKKPAKIAAASIAAVCILAVIALAANPGHTGVEDDEAPLNGDEVSEDFYGIVSNIELGDSSRMIVTVPRIGDMEIPEAEEGKNAENGQNLEDGQNPGNSQYVLPSASEIVSLTSEHLKRGAIVDGVYRVYVRSVSRSAKGIDRYIVDDMGDGEELLFLAFADDCRFLINKKMNGLGYEETSFADFIDLTQELFSYQNAPMLLTFEDGLITEAVLENYYGSGISYDTMYPDTWYEDIQDITSLDEKEVLNTYYTLESKEEMDIGDGIGVEQILVYTGNIGDGDSGIVIFNNAEGELLCSLSAHHARAGWNNIYLGERDGVGFIMTMHIEDRDDFGVYSYHVFRLDDNGDKKLIAGSSFNWGDGIRYEEELFHEWADEMSGYLEDSRLMLSTQEGELNTEHVSEAYKYNYRTLK